MGWSAEQYAKFEDERTRPVRDLLAAVPGDYSGCAVDIGCGPGNSTEVLCRKLPGASVGGIDASIEMIEAARKRLPQLKFNCENIEGWTEAGPFDVILANAVLQWVADHDKLLPSLMAKLSPGGALAVQMPDNLDGPLHHAMRETAAEGPWAGKLRDVETARTVLYDPAGYYDLLRPVSAHVELWRTTYHHVLRGGPSAAVEWFKGSGLRPFLEPLGAAEKSAYLERYTDAISRVLPMRADGSVLLPFPRLFMVAIR